MRRFLACIKVATTAAVKDTVISIIRSRLVSMSLTTADQEIVNLFEQLLRLGPRPAYVDKLRGLVKGDDPEGKLKGMLYAVQLYRSAYEYERGTSNVRGFFHAFLAIIHHLSILPHLNGLWLNYRQNSDFLKERDDKDELKAVAANVLSSVDFARFNAYQESDFADDIKDIDQECLFKCPSGWIIRYKSRNYIIKQQMKNCNLLFRGLETQQDKRIRQEISDNEGMWEDLESFDLAKLVEIDKDNDLVVRESPTYVLPKFKEEVENALERLGREYTHATKTLFLSYVHKSRKKALEELIKSKNKAWKTSVEDESRDNDQMKSDLKRLHEFYKNKSGGISTATSVGREHGHVQRPRDEMTVEEHFG